MNFIKLLNACEETQSTITKTGRFYKYEGRVILEYMKSSRNVWVDSEIASLILDKKDVEQQIIIFFYDKVNNVNFGLEINKDIEDYNAKLDNLVSTIKNDADRKQAEIMVAIFRQ